jgi:RimJ/RimL family protein N-acetyltransferase
MILQRKLETARRLGLRASLRNVLRLVTRLFWVREQLVVFRLLPQQLNAVAPALDDARWSAWSMNGPDFLDRVGAQVPSSLSAELYAAPPDQRVHWIEVDGQVASWGFSIPATRDWPLVETRSRLAVPPGGVYLIGFETLAPLRGRRLYPAILTRILEERFGEGHTAAYIWCRPGNQASYRAIKRVGFQEVAQHEYARLLGVPWRRTRGWHEDRVAKLG